MHPKVFSEAQKSAALQWMRELSYDENPTVVDALFEVLSQCLEAEAKGMGRDKTVREAMRFVYERKQHHVTLLNKAIVRLQEYRAQLLDDAAQLKAQIKDLPLSQ